MTLLSFIAGLFKPHNIDIEKNLLTFSPQKRRGSTVRQKGQLNITVINEAATGALIPTADAGKMVGADKKQIKGISRKDVVGYNAAAWAAVHDDLGLLEAMSKVVTSRDLTCLATSMTIKRLDEEGKPEPSRRLRKKLRDDYGRRGNRISVFFSTGLLKEFMGPFLAMVEYTPTVTQREKARHVFDRCISHMDHAVYVNRLFEASRLVTEVRQRLEVDGARVVLVFGLGDKVIATIEEGVRSLREAYKEPLNGKQLLRFGEERYETKSTRGIMVTVSRLSIFETKDTRAKREDGEDE